MTVHSVHCRLGPIPATPPGRRSVFNRLSVQAPVKHHKRSVSRDLPSASVNMTGRGRELHRGRRASHDTPIAPQIRVIAQAWVKSWYAKKVSSETPDLGLQYPTVMSMHLPRNLKELRGLQGRLLILEDSSQISQAAVNHSPDS